MALWMLPAAILGSSLLGARSAKKAADVQVSAADRAAELQQQQYEQTRADQAPYREAGYNALAEMQRTAGNVPGAFKFGAGDYQADPGYAFRLAEGQKALDRQAAARGGLISGSALKAAQRFGQEMGSQEFQNAYNRAYTGYGTEVARENQLYNRQAGLAGIGQTSANLTGQFGAANAANVGNAIGAAGQAAASGYMGAANALTGGLGQYMNYNQNQAQNSLLQQVLQNRGSTYGYTPTTDYSTGANYSLSGKLGSGYP
jgi:hypothetical protein